ncbi:RloB family protein [Acrocarpospora macrocephala]|uniref:RloB family protein n=1 Tax=Acrocarpospora macrocephala TaxID=150177 RepID=UPI0014785225|nr:RloB family protein [Acrocarpospora macrocephala]
MVYVACEGESTEPDYLQYLNEQFGDGDGAARQPFRIQPVCRKNGMTPSGVVAAVQEAAAEDEAWALFDRDQWIDIPAAVKAAADSRIEFALSHPSFDLWLLLHFQAFSGRQSGSSKIVIEKLRQASEAFTDYDKRGDKSIRVTRRDALRGRENIAITNARSLVNCCAHGSCASKRATAETISDQADPVTPEEWSARSGHAADCPILLRDPSTDVWRLLTALGITVDRA